MRGAKYGSYLKYLLVRKIMKEKIIGTRTKEGLKEGRPVSHI